MLAKALADMDHAAHYGNAHEVRLAWLQLYDIAGPILTGKFIASGAWQDYCPKIDEPTDTASRATLWSDGRNKVIAHVVFVQDVPCDIRLTVEAAKAPRKQR